MIRVRRIVAFVLLTCLLAFSSSRWRDADITTSRWSIPKIRIGSKTMNDDSDEGQRPHETFEFNHDLEYNENHLPLNRSKIPVNQLSLHLVGERHSGTNWISNHLEKCFPNHRFEQRLSRHKHWFQDYHKDRRPPHPHAVVVALFRNPYDWLLAMNKYPYHSPEHMDLPWREFLSKTWSMERSERDSEMDWNNKTWAYDPHWPTSHCEGHYSPYRVVPCLRDEGTAFLYEMKPDGTPFANVLEMRAAKIRNFVNISRAFPDVDLLQIVNYEQMIHEGTQQLLHVLGEWMQFQPSCEALASHPDETFPRYDLPEGFREYVDEHLDWEAEALIGYHRKDFH